MTPRAERYLAGVRPEQRDRTRYGLPFILISWLEENPGTVANPDSALPVALSRGWVPNKRGDSPESARRSVSQALINLAAEGHLTRVRPTHYVLREQR